MFSFKKQKKGNTKKFPLIEEIIVLRLLPNKLLKRLPRGNKINGENK